jgi:hypothetical protein
MAEFEFAPGTETVEAAVFQVIGYASTCWDGGTFGDFREADAVAAGNALIEFLADQQN